MSTGERTAARPLSRKAVGLLCGVGAYTCWGFLPIYFKALVAVSPWELLAHRVVWALLMLLLLAQRQGLIPELRGALRSRRSLTWLAPTTVLIAVNWFVYIWAIASHRILEASLGYFINPLVNVWLGVWLLRERLAPALVMAVIVAGTSVGWLTFHAGQPPWIALSLAVSFALYGLLRKLAHVGALVGLTVETLLLMPLALGYFSWFGSTGGLAFLSGSLSRDVLLVLAGPVTAVPLLLFTEAARRLPLTTIGFLQYLSPSLQFLLAVLLYREPFSAAKGVAFGFIWAGLLIFAAYSLWAGRPEPALQD